MTSDEIGNAIRAFRSPACPACGGVKSHLSDVFCGGCTDQLTPDLLQGLANRETYIETFKPAMDHLGSRVTAASRESDPSPA